ncbi:Mitochondrial ribonuclease P catalytic subunit [Araneus ventricosus]|uniref:Mitochondrial ribonuclease P catalytic subunit n=1 Tax=Araneus ventricosus TaxID=182803 RepID=A0A4Y2MDD4_ARAVE|nr:Mitochondrial ribonuclease P catalytic subunit [Araneus ventricosus]
MAPSTMQEKAYNALENAKTFSASVVQRHFHARSPDLTPCDFFLWCFVKDKVFVPPLPQDLQELKQRIANVLNALTGDLLSRVWQELDYRVGICRVTGGYTSNISRNLDNCSFKISKVIETIFLRKNHPNKWNVSHAKISRRGECNSCKSILKLVDLSDEDFLELRDNFLERSVKKSDIFINTTKKEFDQYIKFINTHKPFEFVLDGLNAAHTFAGDKNPKTLAAHLLKIVDRLSKYSDNVLVLGRHHMHRWPVHIMNRISQKATLFSTSNSSQDDPYMVYAALASGPEAFIVSQDLMRDHIARLDDPKFIWQFKRWQQTHQIYLSVDEDNKFKFLEPLRYSINIQGSMGEGWHIPYDDKIILDPYEELNNWLCVHKVT